MRGSPQAAAFLLTQIPENRNIFIEIQEKCLLNPVKIYTGGGTLKERANRLYELRKSRNLTQTALSLRLNLSLSRISAYENGENIPCDILKDFADFYGVSIDYILRFSDSKTSGLGANLRLSEQKLLKMYRNLSSDGKALIDGMVNGYEPPINK